MNEDYANKQIKYWFDLWEKANAEIGKLKRQIPELKARITQLEKIVENLEELRTR